MSNGDEIEPGAAPARGTDYGALLRRIDYSFRDLSLLEQALTHKSFVNENATLGRKHWERFEFLGDAVVDLVVGHLLMTLRPDAGEGELSKLRAALVSEAGLAELAGRLGLGDWVFVGRGEEASGGRRRPGLLADAFEALVAAVYLDGGFEAAARVLRELLADVEARMPQLSSVDAKTRLQELAASLRVALRYQVLGMVGPDHDRVFEVAIVIDDQERGRGLGRNKKEAEQRAAEAALATREAWAPTPSVAAPEPPASPGGDPPPASS